jgi:ketosteroid isomerase-like protein
MRASDNMRRVRQFLDLVVSGKDYDLWGGMLAEDAERLTPFVPPGLSTITKGRVACVNGAREIFKSIKAFRWIDLDLHETDEPDVIYGTSKSAVELADGRHYENDYVFIFTFANGLIRELREYLNPIPVMECFASELASGGWER